MKTAVVTCAKLENHYIREWVEWYKNLGFTNVIIYDNNDEEGERVTDVIGDYVDSSFAIIEPFYGIQLCHFKAHPSSYIKYGNDYDWLAYFDIDEFLSLNERFHNNIEEYLSMGCFKGKDLIRISWRIYGDNGLVRVEDGDYSLVNRFKEPLPDNKQDKWTKAIVRGGIKNLKFHTSNDGMSHLILMDGVNNSVNANGIPMLNNTIRCGCGYEMAALNHYSTKTIEEFITNKIRKGWPVILNPDVFNLDFFFMQNEKTEEKEEIYKKLISEMK